MLYISIESIGSRQEKRMMCLAVSFAELRVGVQEAIAVRAGFKEAKNSEPES